MRNYRIFLSVILIFSLVYFNCSNQKRKINSFNLVEFAESERQWTGVAVSKEGRIFVNYPRWSADVPVSVAEILESGEIKPYPDEKWNNWAAEKLVEEYFVCVQSVYVDDKNFLWILDPGMVAGKGVVEKSAKLLKVDLTTDEIIEKIYFDSETALQMSYLNDVRIDTKKDFAYITDSGTGAIVIVNLKTGKSRRVLSEHPSTKSEDVVLTIEGIQWLYPGGRKPQIHSDGIALDKNREYLYYQALTGHSLYRIKTEYLLDVSLSESELGEKVELITKSGPADGIAFGPDGDFI